MKRKGKGNKKEKGYQKERKIKIPHERLDIQFTRASGPSGKYEVNYSLLLSLFININHFRWLVLIGETREH